MGEVHFLLEAKGKQGALQSGFERDVIEAASAYMTDEDSSLGFAFSGWAQCALPHRSCIHPASIGRPRCGPSLISRSISWRNRRRLELRGYLTKQPERTLPFDAFDLQAGKSTQWRSSA